LGSQGIFHPHIHALVADGVFSESGAFCVLPATPSQLLVQQLRHAVLSYLVEEGQQVHVNVDEQLTPTNDRMSSTDIHTYGISSPSVINRHQI
jgi:hypothetical protein